MRTLRIAALVVIIFIVGGVIYNARYAARGEYIKAVEKLRADKDAQFSTADDSPLKGMGTFKGLKYFETNPDYKVTAELEVANRPDTAAMRFNNGQTKPYLKFAVARFNLQGQACQLWLFKPVGDDSPQLFLPFTDATNGQQTYASGRFLDVDYSNTNQVELDFNQAYNPYCAYNTQYVCPVPPAENRLKLAVQAGEKAYQDAH